MLSRCITPAAWQSRCLMGKVHTRRNTLEKHKPSLGVLKMGTRSLILGPRQRRCTVLEQGGEKGLRVCDCSPCQPQCQVQRLWTLAIKAQSGATWLSLRKRTSCRSQTSKNPRPSNTSCSTAAPAQDPWQCILFTETPIPSPGPPPTLLRSSSKTSWSLDFSLG